MNIEYLQKKFDQKKEQLKTLSDKKEMKSDFANSIVKEMEEIQIEINNIKNAERKVGNNNVIATDARTTFPRSTDQFEYCKTGRLTAYENSYEGRKNAYIVGQFIKATNKDLDVQERQVLYNYVKDQTGVDMGSYHTRALSTTTNESGGFLVPTILQDAIIRIVLQYGVAGNHLNQIQMSAQSERWPVRLKGQTAAWQQELESGSLSDAGFEDVELKAKTLMGIATFSNQLGENSIISISNFVTQELAYALSYKMDAALFSGSGDSSNGGIVGLPTAYTNFGTKFNKTGTNNPAIAYVNGVSGGLGNISASAWNSAYTGLIGKLPPYQGAKNCIYTTNFVWASTMLNSGFAAIGNNFVSIQNGTPEIAAGGYTKTYLGYPVILCEIMNIPNNPTVGTNIAYLGDLSMVGMLGTRGDMSMLTTNLAGNNFTNLTNQTRAVMSTDIALHSILGYAGDNTTVIAGPLVALQVQS